jgi:hypothetical protein
MFSTRGEGNKTPQDNVGKVYLQADLPWESNWACAKSRHWSHIHGLVLSVPH